MPDTEVEVKVEDAPIGEWRNLGESVIKLVKNELKDRSQETMECFSKGLSFENVEPKRLDQVAAVLNAGIQNLALIRLQADKTMRLGIDKKVCKGNINVIHFNVDKDLKKEEVVDDINNVITHANKLLEKFDKPPVPELDLQ